MRRAASVRSRKGDLRLSDGLRSGNVTVRAEAAVELEAAWPSLHESRGAGGRLTGRESSRPFESRLDSRLGKPGGLRHIGQARLGRQIASAKE